MESTIPWYRPAAVAAEEERADIALEVVSSIHLLIPDRYCPRRRDWVKRSADQSRMCRSVMRICGCLRSNWEESRHEQGLDPYSFCRLATRRITSRLCVF